MRRLKVLELFSGTRSVSKAFERRGHETFCVDYDERFEADWHADVGKITAEQIVNRFGHPDVLFASPDCSSFSLAAISKHRRKDPAGGGVARRLGVCEGVRPRRRQPDAHHQGPARAAHMDREPARRNA